MEANQRFWIGASLIAAALAVAGIAMQFTAEVPTEDVVPAEAVVPVAPPLPAVSAAARQAAWRKIQPTLEQAGEDMRQAVVKHCDAISGFFNKRSERSREFAERVFSLRSKWEFLKSHLPGSDGDEHRRFLRDAFEEIIFSQKELEDVLRSAMVAFLQDVQGIENDLLVNIRADLADSDLPELRSLVSTDAGFREQFLKSLDFATNVVSSDLKVVVGREIVAWVASDLATSILLSSAGEIATRLGVSGAAIGSSWVATLGVGIAAGIVIDAMLDWILHAVGYDPVLQVQLDVECAVFDFGAFLIDGDDFVPLIQRPLHFLATFAVMTERHRGWSPDKTGKEPYRGLQHHMTQCCNQRSAVRTAALQNLILKGGR
jgi:hypothetical protein